MQLKYTIASIATTLIVVFGCSSNDNPVDTTVGTIVKVKASDFLSAGLSEPISVVSRTLSNGTTADCYKIVCKSLYFIECLCHFGKRCH